MESNLVKARSSIVFIMALLVAFSAVFFIEKKSSERSVARMTVLPASPGAASCEPERLQAFLNFQLEASADIGALQVQRTLTRQEMQWARIAWKYFKNNVNRRTGLVNSVDKYPVTSLWDTASHLMAILSARKLGIITQGEFDIHVGKVLYSLEHMPLFDSALPNKAYRTTNLAMVDYRNQLTKAGVGWSAIDLGRLLISLNVIARNYPQHTLAVRRTISRWNTDRLVENGQMFGAEMKDGRAQRVQEGRLGYEQYAAKAFNLIGLDVSAAADYRPHFRQTTIYGIQVPYDQRDAYSLKAHNYVLSEPYVLDGLELGWDRFSRELAWRVYRVQEERFRKTGMLTAVTEDHVDRAPYFVYNTVFTNGKAWNTLTEKGEDASALRSLSVKASFGWHALYRSEYTGKLIQAVAGLYDPDRGWYAGLYEEGAVPNQSLNVNTNAVVLESLAYIAHGKLLGYR